MEAASQRWTKSFGLEEYLDLIVEVETSEAQSELTRIACLQLKLAMAFKKFAEILQSKELALDKNGVKIITVRDVDAVTLEKCFVTSTMSALTRRSLTQSFWRLHTLTRWIRYSELA